MIEQEDRARRDRASDIGGLLAKVIKEKKWRNRFQLHAVFDFWNEAVGPEISGRAQPLFIRGNVLWVAVSDSVWMQQLQFQKTLLLDIVSRRHGQGEIADIRFQLDISLGGTPGPESTARAVKPVDKDKLHEFDTLLSSLKDGEVRESLRNLWIKSQENR